MTSRPEPSFYLSFFLFTTDPRPGDPAARALLLGQVRELVAMGYGGFELPIPPSGMANPEAEVEAYRQLRQALDAEGFEAVALTTNVAATPDFDPTSADAAVRERALAMLRTCGYLDVVDGREVNTPADAETAVARLMEGRRS